MFKETVTKPLNFYNRCKTYQNGFREGFEAATKEHNEYCNNLCKVHCGICGVMQNKENKVCVGCGCDLAYYFDYNTV